MKKLYFNFFVSLIAISLFVFASGDTIKEKFDSVLYFQIFISGFSFSVLMVLIYSNILLLKNFYRNESSLTVIEKMKQKSILNESIYNGTIFAFISSLEIYACYSFFNSAYQSDFSELLVFHWLCIAYFSYKYTLQNIVAYMQIKNR